MGNVLCYRHVIALRNLGFIEEDVLDLFLHAFG